MAFVAMRGLTLQQNQLFLCRLVLHMIDMKLPAYELTPCVSKFCLDEWQDIRDCCDGVNFILFTPVLALSNIAKICPATTLLNRLRIAHSHLTHSYLLCGDDPPTCQSCGIPFTVKHTLVECTNLRDIREKYFTVSSVS